MPTHEITARTLLKRSAIVVIAGALVLTLPCDVRAADGGPGDSQRVAAEPTGLRVHGSGTVELKAAGLLLEFHQDLESTEGDPKAIDAELATMQSKLSSILNEGAVVSGSSRMAGVRAGSPRDSGSKSKSRGGGGGGAESGSATWIVRVPDRAAAEAVLIRAAAIGKQLEFQSMSFEFKAVDPAARQAALTAAGADAVKAAEAAISQTNFKVGRLLAAHETVLTTEGGSISASQVFIFGTRVWMRELPNPTITCRLECRFEILAK
ncbi:MAG: SIMPL domain-containing protein [Phycisphaerales bacterium]